MFIDESKQIDTRTLNYYADVVITCVGSAGFELPAISGIPAVIAGDSLCSEFNICKEPKSKSEYFQLLSNLEKLKKINKEQISTARLTYLYLHKYCAVNMPVCPSLTLDEQNFSDIPDTYIKELGVVYNDHHESTLSELLECISYVSYEKFIRLNEMSLLNNASRL